MASVISPEVTLSYPKLFKSELPPNAKPTDKKKWSTTALFTAEAVASAEFKNLVAACVAAAREKWPDAGDAVQFDAKGMAFVFIGKQEDGVTIRMPFRRDIKAKGYDSETFKLFLNLSKTDNPDKNVSPPEVIDRSGRKVTDYARVYPGVRARFSCNPFPYSNMGNSGVSLGLNNVQILGDGPRIDSRKAAVDEFGTLPEEAPAALDGPAGPGLSAMLA